MAWVHAFPDCLHDFISNLRVALPQPVPLPRAEPLSSGTAYPLQWCRCPRPCRYTTPKRGHRIADCASRRLRDLRLSRLLRPGQCGAADLGGSKRLR